MVNYSVSSIATLGDDYTCEEKATSDQIEAKLFY